MFIAIDGNSTGRLIERMILENNLDELTEFSTKIQSKIQSIRKYITQYGGRIIIAGGDNVLAEIPSSIFRNVLVEFGTLSDNDYSFSAAISGTALGAYFGLNYAKASGVRVVKADMSEGTGVVFSVIDTCIL